MKKNMTNNQVLLKECIKQEFSEATIYSNKSVYFEHFAASHVLKDYNLSDSEIDDGNTGGGCDGGCDNIYLFLNGEIITFDQVESLSAARGSTLELCIVQAKNELGFSEDAIMKWKTISSNLLSISNTLDLYKGRYNEKTIEYFSLFRDSVTKLFRSQVKIIFHFYYVTLANEVHPNVLQQADELKKVVNKIYPSAKVEVKFVGADKLMELYNSDSETRLNLDFASQLISLSQKDFIGLVKLGTYYRFITNEKNEIRKNFFEANVRDYQGHNSVNNRIAETLEYQTQGDFWWLNNGITMLSPEITFLTQTSLQIVDPEIVNGQQTSREIFNYFSRNQDKIDKDKRTVLIRIIHPNSEESRDNIIFATNNQTAIPKASLRVTDPIHLQIEMYLRNRGLYYDRRKNYYKNQKKKSADIVGVSFLAQCLISIILRKPDFARARPSTLLTEDETYSTLYSKDNPLEAYYKAAKLGKMVYKNLSLSVDMAPTEKGDILFYVIYGIVAKTLNKKQISFNELANFDLSMVTDDTINAIKTTVFNKYKELGGNGKIVKNSSFVSEVDTAIGI